MKLKPGVHTDERRALTKVMRHPADRVDDEAAWRRYPDAPARTAFVDEHVLPLADSWWAMQIPFPSAEGARP